MASKRQQVSADGTITWQVRFRHDNRETSKTFHTQHAANTFMKLLDRLGPDEAIRVNAEQQAGTSADTPLLVDYALAEVDLRTGITERTRQEYKRQIRRDWKDIGLYPIDQVTSKTVRAWVRGLEKSGISGKTIANKHGLLYSVFRSAMRDEDLDLNRNPCEGTRLPRKDDGTDEMVFLTQAEFITLLDYIPKAYQPFVTFLAATGLRYGEAVALQVKDWQPEKFRYGAVNVAKALKRTPNGFEVGPPKTKKANRTVAVAQQLAATLNEIAKGKSGDDLLFPNVNTGKTLQHSFFHRLIWQPAVNLANGEKSGRPKEGAEPTVASLFYGITPATVALGKRPRIHDLRHTAASWMLETTGDIQAVQYMLGHESITTTVDRYGHMVPRRQDAIAEGMSRALATVLPQVESGETLTIEG